MANKRGLRILAVAVLLLLFAGLIAYSVLKVRYWVPGGAKTELNVTLLIQTHGIERGKDGKLTLLAAPGKGEGGQGKGGAQPCPT